MKKALALPLIVTVTLSVLWPNRAPGQVVIAEKGKPKAVIVIAADVGPVEKYAADELAFFLHFMVGAPVPLAVAGSAEAAAAPGQTRLLVGEGAVRLADPAFRSASLKAEEIVVRSQGRDLILAGGGRRGTLYAVYTFLEDVLGCRWWTSTAWHVPREPSLAVPPVAIRYAPPLEYREPFWFTAFDRDWAARTRPTAPAPAATTAAAGATSMRASSTPSIPSFRRPTYFDAHPEWFSEINGKRTSRETPSSA